MTRYVQSYSEIPARDDRLTLIEELEPGPYEHKPLFDDPLFERFEPHSSIRLAYVIQSCDDNIVAYLKKNENDVQGIF